MSMTSLWIIIIIIIQYQHWKEVKGGRAYIIQIKTTKYGWGSIETKTKQKYSTITNLFYWTMNMDL